MLRPVSGSPMRTHSESNSDLISAKRHLFRHERRLPSRRVQDWNTGSQSTHADEQRLRTGRYVMRAAFVVVIARKGFG